MQSKQPGYKTSLPLLLKCGGIFIFFLLAIIVVACGSTSGQIVPGTPVATLTVVFGQSNGSPTPGLANFYCGGWATNTTPGYSTSGVVNVYGKFIHTVNGNPVGVANATAVATVLWPDGSSETEKTTTTGDGLAVFSIAIQASAINHVVLVQMTFTSSTGDTCSIPSAAFFTAILVSPTPTNTANPGPSGTPTGGPSVTPSVFPTGSPILLPTPTKKGGH